MKSVKSKGSRFFPCSLSHVDLSRGQWLMQDTIGPVSGLAFLLELHYTHTLQDSDMIRAGTLFGSTARLQNVANRQDVVNFTIGLHTQMMDDTAIRVGAVFPLREHDNRLFDSELTVQVNRRF